ncbi:MAG: cytochrome c3 family protein [Geobacteraceae bacterium]|nr:cytochrome c3 family protein [Geobacteraceae bacterium]
MKRNLCYVLVLCVSVALVWGCNPRKPRGVGMQKTCLECHEEYNALAQQKVVHAPVEEKNCNGCHRNHGIIGGAYLLKAVPQVCYSCHEGFSPAQLAENVHQPVAQGNCKACHEPHGGEHKRLHPVAAQELCFECHTRTEYQNAGPQAHPPVAQGCGTCHAPHSSTAPELLHQEESAMCATCHPAASVSAAHGGISATRCAECHDPHGGREPSLWRTSVHEPVASGECASCHQGGALGGELLCVSRSPRQRQHSTPEERRA